MRSAVSLLKNLDYAEEPFWGYAVYRTSNYDDDAKWVLFLERLRTAIAWEYTYGNQEKGEEAAQRLNLVVIEDRERFEGASIEVVREHFLTWIENQGQVPGSASRYEICILADSASVESVLASKADPPDRESNAYAIVVDGNYSPDDDYDNETYRGWMKVALSSLGRLYMIITDLGMARFYRGTEKPWSEVDMLMRNR